MITPRGKLSSILVLLDPHPVQDVEFYTTVVEFLARRVGTEIERHHMGKKLEKQVAERTLALKYANNKLKNTVEQLKKTSHQMEVQSRSDLLTGINNRRFLLELATRQLKLAKRHQEDVSVLFIDLDMFKKIFKIGFVVGIKTFGFFFNRVPKPLIISVVSEILVFGMNKLNKCASSGEKSDKALAKIRDIALMGIETWAKANNTITDNKFLKETEKKLDIKRCPKDFNGY